MWGSVTHSSFYGLGSLLLYYYIHYVLHTSILYSEAATASGAARAERSRRQQSPGDAQLDQMTNTRQNTAMTGKGNYVHLMKLFLDKFVKTHQVNLILAGFSHFKP